MKKLTLLLLALWGGFYVNAQTGVNAENLQITRRLMEKELQGLVPLRFGNALDNKPVAGAAVEIPGVGTFTTDREGIVAFSPPEDGYYTLTFSKAGFITAEIEFEVALSTVFHNRFLISPVLAGGTYRIVLEWAEAPKDIDLHLEKEGSYHISWRDMRSAADNSARLDRDARDGFGPETITVTKSDPGATYSIFVVDFSNFTREGSRDLSASSAVVRIFYENSLVQSFAIPPNTVGNRWNVARLSGGTLTPVNTVTRSY
ncbi:MAG: hypothetical protein LBC31_09670 [Treponema sp.]|jgi:hypothetical protein|nr:hypothetical protein [Treponema sp.]